MGRKAPFEEYMDSAIIDIKNDITIFTCENQSQIILDIGYKKLIREHFKSQSPTPLEIEAAIITIEDSIERIYSTWPPTIDELITKNAQLSLIRHFFDEEEDLGVNHIELLFNRIVDIISGSPKRGEDLPDSNEFIACLLILREVLHHLSIKMITIN